MSHNAISDKEIGLAEDLKEGSVKAFEAIYRLYVDRLYSYCYEAIHEHRETEETVHDVFMTLWSRRASLDPPNGVGPLLFAIASRRRIDAFRRLMQSPVYEDYVAFQNTLPSGDNAPMEYDDFSQTFYRVLKSLPMRSRRVVELIKLEGHDVAEVAARLGVSEKTVRNQLSIALKELSSRLRPLIDGAQSNFVTWLFFVTLGVVNM